MDFYKEQGLCISVSVFLKIIYIRIFMKRWHSKNGSGYGGNPRNA